MNRTDPTRRPDEPDRDVVALLDRAGHEPTASFRAHLEDELRAVAASTDVTTLRSTRDRREHRRRLPLLAGAAAVLALIAIVAVVNARSDSGLTPAEPTVPDETDDALVPLPLPAPDALQGTELFTALADRQWLGIERFDTVDPPTALPTIIISGEPDRSTLLGRSGCWRYGGDVSFDGNVVTGTDFTTEKTTPCEIDESVRLESGQAIELAPGADEFLLRSDDGAPVARFVDGASLPFATAEELLGTWLLTGVERIDFAPGGVGGGYCVPITWTNTDGRIALELRDLSSPACDSDSGVVAGGPGTVTEFVRSVIADDPDVRVAPSGLVVTSGGVSAVLLARPPVVESDPDGITLAAGTVFGIEPGLGVTPDQVLETVSSRLGEPDRDTGWLDGLNDGRMWSCDLADFRVISWGDLEFVFWGTGSRTLLLAWYVGDPSLLSNNTPEVERSDATPTGLRTEAGLGIGDPASTIPTAITVGRATVTDTGSLERFRVEVSSANPDANRPQELPLRGGTYLVIDGAIAAFGSEAFTC